MRAGIHRHAAVVAVGWTAVLASIACEPAKGGAPELLPQSELRYGIARATFFGGPHDEEARKRIVQPDSSLLIGMEAKSAGLPTSENAFQYSTFLGGAGKEFLRSSTVAPDGSIFLVGRTDSADFPLTPGAFQTRPGGDAFVVKLVSVGADALEGGD
jgi:hypothetical protein